MQPIIPDRSTSRHAGRYAGTGDVEKLFEVLRDSLQIALESKVEETARSRYDLALECYHRLLELGLPAEIETTIRGYVEEMVARFPTAWRVNVALGALERASAAMSSVTREERMAEARQVLEDGLASGDGVERDEIEALLRRVDRAQSAESESPQEGSSEEGSYEESAEGLGATPGAAPEPTGLVVAMAEELPFAEAAAPLPLPEVDVTLGALPRVHLAMLQERRAAVHTLSVQNRSGEELEGLELEVVSDPPFIRSSRLRVESLDAGEELVLGPRQIGSFLSHDRSILGQLSERADSTVTAVLRDASGAELARTTSTWMLFPTDAWFGLGTLPELLAAYVLPNDPAVDGTLALVAPRLQAATDSPSIDGYQSKDPVRALRIVEAAYESLRDAEVTYANPPASFEDDGQRVRFPGKVLSTRLGTCLDLALFAAAVLEQAGLHPLIVITEGHAFVAAWLIEEMFAGPVIEEPGRLLKRIELSEIVAFDATCVAQRPSPDFEGARAAALERLRDPAEFRVAIDVQRARLGGVLPLPTLEAGVHAAADGVPQEDAAPTRSTRDLDEELRVYLEAERRRREDEETPGTRLDRWLRQLLDLTMRNRLLNSAQRSKRIIPLIPGELGPIEDRLADGKVFRVLERPVELESQKASADDLERIAPLLDAGVRSGELRSWLSGAELDERLLTLYREARTAREEGGAGALYLAIGFLVYTETPQSTKARRAPLLLVPLELKRKSARRGYSLSQGADEPRANVTLLEYLRRDHQIDVAGLDPLPTDERGVDVPLVLRIFKDAIKDVDGWEVAMEAEVGLYSFAKYLLWRDLKDRADVLRRNDLVAHLIERPSEPFPGAIEIPDPAALDASFSAAEVFAPLSYDSSQLSAILAAADGKTMVLEGPPGTGKSQTITNLIAHAIAQEKTVLFVSEKMAALDVVHRRLQHLGLGPACLELHSNKANKKAVLEQFREALEEGRVRGSRRRPWSEIAGDLDAMRARLNDHVRALHEPRGIGESMHDVLGHLAASSDEDVWDLESDLGIADPRAVEAATLADWRALLDEIDIVAAEQLVGPEHPLLLVGQTEYSPIFEAESLRSIRAFDAPAAEFLAAARGALRAFGALGRSAEDEERGAPEAAEGWRALAELLRALDGEFPGASSAERWLQGGAAIDAATQALALVEEKSQLAANASGLFRVSPTTLPLDELEAVRREYTGGGFFTRWRRKGALLTPFRGIALDPKRVGVDEAIAALDAAQREVELAADIEVAGAQAASVLGDRWEGEGTDVTAARASTEEAARLVGALASMGSSRDVWTSAVLRALGEKKLAGNPAEKPAYAERAAELVQRLEALVAARAALVEAARPLPGAPLSVSLRDVAALQRHSVTWADLWRDKSGGLRGWTRWQVLRASALDTANDRHGAGLRRLVERMEAGDGCAPGELRQRFDAAFARGWTLHEISADEALKAFDGGDHGRRVKSFRELDDERLAAAREEVRQRVGARRPKPSGLAAAAGKASKTGLGLLQREITKKTRHLAIRRLLAELDGVAMELKPCFLMSPMSVAQYLDAEHPPFDIVVFDEASQIPVWDAIGAIARGTQAVIVGDPKQLPPTSFFSRSADQDAPAEGAFEDDVEDLESILEECMGAQVPTHRLRWHYRSRHETLIAFSNERYYDGKLLTFPSGASEGRGVHLVHHADAVYDKGRTRTNSIEARAVASEVVRRLQDRRARVKSIGVVTFSQAQQTLILDLLEAEQRKHPEIEPFFDEAALEPVFVKNLENVQGDERDVIIFSIGYGPDANGRLSMNFGPLNNDGGERRLNVAITRAREEVLVHTSIRSDQIDLARTGARGVRDLRAFLAFAEDRDRAIETVGAAGSGDQLATSIGERLVALGWDVDYEVGRSDVRIDLGVRHPQRPDAYLAGVETDGPYYERASTARDRDRLRGDVLAGLGWRLVRVWSVDWWRDAEGEAQRIDAELRAFLDEEPLDEADFDAADEALMLAEPESSEAPSLPAPKEGASEVRESEPLESGEGDLDEGDAQDGSGPKRLAAAPVQVAETGADATEPILLAPAGPSVRAYAPASVPGHADDSAAFYDEESDRAVLATIANIIEQEAPLTEETLIRRVASAWGFAAVSKKFRERVHAALGSAGHPVTEHALGDDGETVQRVLWRTGGEAFAGYRTQDDSDARAILEVPLPEVVNALAAAVERRSPYPLDELQRDVLAEFGGKRLTQGPRQLLGAALDELQESGKIRTEISGGVAQVVLA